MISFMTTIFRWLIIPTFIPSGFSRQIFTTTVWSFQGAQGVTNYFRPMMTLGYLLTYKIAGPISFGFHLVNLVLNGIAVLLVFYLLQHFAASGFLVAAGCLPCIRFTPNPSHGSPPLPTLNSPCFILRHFCSFLNLPETSHKLRARGFMCALFALARYVYRKSRQ